MIPTRLPKVAALAALLAASSCMSTPDAHRFGSTRTGRANAMLVAARARRINLFGEISDRPGSRYYTRSSVSLRQHSFTGVGHDTDPDLDPSGDRMVFASTRHNESPDLYIKAVEGVAVTQLTSDPASDIQPVWSPDGNKVAFSSNRSGNWDIWVIGAGGGQPMQVTSGAAEDVHPSWSPDGTQLVYCSLPPRGGQWELWIADSIAGGRKHTIGYGLFPEWSPTGSTIVFQRPRERGTRWFSVWTIQLVDGEPRYPTEIAASSDRAMILPTWSPDGRQVAFASTDTLPVDGPAAAPVIGNFDIWVVNADGSGAIRLTDGYTSNFAPVFAPDGRVFFASSRAGHENIWSQAPLGPGASYPPSATVNTYTAPDAGAEKGRRPTSAMNVVAP